MVRTQKARVEVEATMDDRVTQGFRGIAGAAKRAFAPIEALDKTVRRLAGALAGVFVVRSLGRFIASIDEIGKLSATVNSTTESVSELAFAFDAAGIGAQQLNPVLTALRRQQGAALRGVTGQVEAFRDLGISVQQLRDLGAAELFEQIARGAVALGDAQEQTRVLSALFPERFRGLLALFPTLDESLETARKFGATVGQEAVKAAAEFQDAWLQLTTAFSALMRDLVVTFTPLLSSLVNAVSGAIRTVRSGVEALRTSDRQDDSELFRRFSESLQPAERQRLSELFAGAARGVSGSLPPSRGVDPDLELFLQNQAQTFAEQAPFNQVVARQSELQNYLNAATDVIDAQAGLNDELFTTAGSVEELDAAWRSVRQPIEEVSRSTLEAQRALQTLQESGISLLAASITDIIFSFENWEQTIDNLIEALGRLATELLITILLRRLAEGFSGGTSTTTTDPAADFRIDSSSTGGGGVKSIGGGANYNITINATDPRSFRQMLASEPDVIVDISRAALERDGRTREAARQ